MYSNNNELNDAFNFDDDKDDLSDTDYNDRNSRHILRAFIRKIG